MQQNKSISFDEGSFIPQVEIDSYRQHKSHDTFMTLEEFMFTQQDYIAESELQKIKAFSQLNQNNNQQQQFEYQIINMLINHPRVETPLREGQYQQSIDELKTMENLLEQKVYDYQSLDGIHLLYFKMGNICLYMKELYCALDHYFQARNLVQRIDEHMDCAKIEYALALVYQSQNLQQASLKHLINGFQLQIKYKGEKDQENLIICRKIIENLKQQGGLDQALLYYCRKYLQISASNGYYQNGKEQLEYYSIVKCTARMYLKHKQYSEGAQLLEASINQLYNDQIDFQNQQVYVYEISKILVQFRKQTVDYKSCEKILDVLINLSKEIYGEESLNTAQLYSDIGHLQNVLLQNNKSYQSLKKSYNIFKKFENFKEDPKFQQVMDTMNKLNHDLHNQNAIQQRLQQYNVTNEKTTVSIMEEFNRVGKLYCKKGQMAKSLQNYEISQILFQQLPQEIQELESVQKMENKLLINYSILLINQNQPLVALIFLNQIRIFKNINIKQQQQQQQNCDINDDQNQNNSDDSSNQEEIDQNISDNFQVYYRQGICYEKLDEKLQALECFSQADNYLKMSENIMQNNFEKQEYLQKKINEFSQSIDIINID